MGGIDCADDAAPGLPQQFPVTHRAQALEGNIGREDIAVGILDFIVPADEDIPGEQEDGGAVVLVGKTAGRVEDSGFDRRVFGQIAPAAFDKQPGRVPGQGVGQRIDIQIGGVQFVGGVVFNHPVLDHDERPLGQAVV